MVRIFDKLVGAVKGFFSGLIKGWEQGSHYYAKKWEKQAPPFGSFAGSVMGALWGGIQHALKGSVYGFKHGSQQAGAYSDTLEQHYFGRIQQNKELKKYINQSAPESKSPAIRLLNASEQKQFEEHLKNIKDVELRSKLEKDYAFYQDYLQRICPLTNKPVFKHHDPLEIEVQDPNTHETVTKTYDRKHFISEINKNIQRDNITKEIDTGVRIFPENITHVGFPTQIVNFVKTVRSRLNAILSLLSADPNMLRDYGYEKIKVRSPVNQAKSITAPSEIPTPVESIASAKAEVQQDNGPVNDKVQTDEKLGSEIEQQVQEQEQRRSARP